MPLDAVKHIALTEALTDLLAACVLEYTSQPCIGPFECRICRQRGQNADTVAHDPQRACGRAVATLKGEAA